jgi:hypothetical protein
MKTINFNVKGIHERFTKALGAKTHSLSFVDIKNKFEII